MSGAPLPRDRCSGANVTVRDLRPRAKVAGRVAAYSQRCSEPARPRKGSLPEPGFDCSSEAPAAFAALGAARGRAHSRPLDDRRRGCSRPASFENREGLQRHRDFEPALPQPAFFSRLLVDDARASVNLFCFALFSLESQRVRHFDIWSMRARTWPVCVEGPFPERKMWKVCDTFEWPSRPRKRSRGLPPRSIDHRSGLRAPP